MKIGNQAVAVAQLTDQDHDGTPHVQAEPGDVGHIVDMRGEQTMIRWLRTGRVSCTFSHEFAVVPQA